MLNTEMSTFSQAFDQASSLWSHGDVRRQSLCRAVELGLPTTQSEAWKYTDLKSLAQQSYQVALMPAQLSDVGQKAIRRCHQNYTHVVTLINGHFSLEHSKLEQLPLGLQVQPLSQAVDQFSQRQQELFWNQQGSRSQDFFIALNSSFFQDGAFIFVDREVSISEPVCVLNLQESDISHVTPLQASRHWIQLSSQSSLTIVEEYESGEGPYLSTPFTYIDLADASSLSWVRWQQGGQRFSSVGQTQVYMGRDSRLRGLSVDLGGQLSRHSLDIQVNGVGAEAEVQGLSLVRPEGHIDHRTQIFHNQAQGISRQLYKSVVAEKGRAVFNGKIYIAKDAQKVDSNLYNYNLLLGERAEADTKPELEVYADDVKAAHGATVGQLDSEQVFYLCSRGLARSEALNMLMLGFIEDLVRGFPEKKVSEVFVQRLREWTQSNLMDLVGVEL